MTIIITIIYNNNNDIKSIICASVIKINLVEWINLPSTVHGAILSG